MDHQKNIEWLHGRAIAFAEPGNVPLLVLTEDTKAVFRRIAADYAALLEEGPIADYSEMQCDNSEWLCWCESAREHRVYRMEANSTPLNGAIRWFKSKRIRPLRKLTPPQDERTRG